MKTLKNKKGFTLVEVIVVLVILAILAGIMIPAMTGWIDKASNQTLITPCRTCVVAAQTLASEAYATAASAASVTVDAAKVKELAGVSGAVSAVELDSATLAVDKLTYTEGGKSVTYLRTPEPHFVFGEGELSAAEQVAANMNALYEKYAELKQQYPNNYNRVDSSALSTPTSKARQLYDSLSPEEQQFFDDKVWMMKYEKTSTSGDEKVFRIFFTMEKYPPGTQNVTVFKYDPVSGLYQITKQGSVDSSGNIEATNGFPKDNSWYDWNTAQQKANA